MSDYICVECGCGFPERGNRTRVRDVNWLGDPEEADSWITKWVLKFDNAIISAFKSAYYVSCPECGHRVGEGCNNEN